MTNIHLIIFRYESLRYVALWLARTLGRIYRWLKSEWRPPVIWLAVIAFGVWLAESLFNLPAGTWFLWWKILSLYAILMLLWWAWQARKRVVVEEFIDYSNQPSKSVARGLSSLLVVELGRLRNLYRVVNEMRAIPTTVEIDRPIDATIKVEDISETLKSAVSAESKFSLGPLEIPVGTLMALVGRLVSGPRIIGGLHKDKDLHILTAQMIGIKGSYIWRIDDPTPLEQSMNHGTRGLDDMIKELACRIFTDFALSGSVRWKATWNFKEGLRAYRDCLRTRKEHKQKLIRAEKRFIETLAEDKEFPFAYYNLGVVYSELRRTEASESAFSNAIEQNPNQWQAFYALGLQNYKHKRCEPAIQMCERVIALKPDIAKAYDLKGLAQRCLGNLKSATESRQMAVSISWKALCMAELRGEGNAETEDSMIPPLRVIASSCLRNLAVAYFFQAKQSQAQKSLDVMHRAFQTAEALFRQALSLSPSDADLHFELGKTYYEQRKYNLALQEYESALQIFPANAKFWAYLALTYNAQKNEKSEQDTWEKFLNFAFLSSKEDLEETAEVCEKLGIADWNKRIKEMKELPDEIENLLNVAKQDVKKSESGESELQKKLAEYDRDGREWEYAQVATGLGRLYLDKKPAEAEEYFQKTIGKLKDKYPDGIRSLGLRGWLALSLIKQQKHSEALQEVEKARWLNPLRSWERMRLGDVFFALNEFEQARAAWEEALLYDPDDPATHIWIGIAYSKLAIDYRETIRRNTSLQQAVNYLGKALDLYESDKLKGKGWAHYWLGILHIELSDYEKAISHLKIAQTLASVPLVATYHLGWAYLKNKAYDECVGQFNQVIREADDLNKNKGKPFDENVGAEFQHPMFLGEVLAWAYLSKAFSYAERDVNFEEALSLTGKAKDYLSELKDVVARDRCEAAYADCVGWILYKQGKIDDAITYLENAVAQTNNAGAYLHIALAYEHKLQECKDKAQLQFLIAKIQAYCQHAQQIDIKNEFSQRLNDLRLRLDKKSQGEQQIKAGIKTA